MTEICKTCGTELFAGQRFCRACGNRTDTLDAGEAPTQEMPPVGGEAPTQRMLQQPDDWGARGAAHTAPQSRPHTNPVGQPPPNYQAPNTYQAPPTSYQLPPQPLTWQPPRYPPPPTPTRSGSSWAIVLAVILALMLGTVIGGRIIYKRIRARIPEFTQQIPPPPPVPSTDKQVFALNPGATVTIKTTNGSIKIEGWDEPKAEVKIIKRGGNDNPAVTIHSDEKSLSMEAPPDGRGGPVSFEVKLPRELGKVSLNSDNGAITLKNVDGQISVETSNGSINLNNVSGVELAKAGNGSIDAVLNQAVRDRPMTFETGNGSIKLTIDDEFNATLDASTARGRIDVDGDLEGIKTERRVPFGATASGNLGSGGPTLKVTTTNGSIKINK